MSKREQARRIVITGAAGRVGGRLRTHFEGLSDRDVVLIDHDCQGASGIHSADLSRYDRAWTDLFAGADAIIHLAGDPRPSAPWASVAKNNIEATFNVFKAAAAHGVRRIVYASSLMTMEGHRFGREPIVVDTPARPVSFYGVSKLVGEEIGSQFAREGTMSVICLRIGVVQTGDVPAGRDLNGWRRSKWLCGADLCQAFEKAIQAADTNYAILPVVSDNANMRWNLAETCRVLGYTPTKCTTVKPPYFHVRIRGLLGWVHKRWLDPAWRDYRD